jgi:YggT family protein
VSSLLEVYDLIFEIVRRAFAWFACIAALIFALDWAVRTGRIDSRSGLASFLRKYVDPLIRPIERRIVRAGGMPSSAPWWTLAAVVIGGIVVIWALDFIRRELAVLYISGTMGAVGILRLLISWTFSIMQVALLLRVLSSWVGLSTYSKWLRWTVVLTEPILAPLRRLIPPLGMIDITPLVAFFILSLTRGLLLAAI